jgi:hypothetical protein
VAATVFKKYTTNVNYKSNKCIEVFGADIFVDTLGNCRLLEINIGPGMKPFSEKDSVLRKNLYRNVLHLANGKVSDDFNKIL